MRGLEEIGTIDHGEALTDEEEEVREGDWIGGVIILRALGSRGS